MWFGGCCDTRSISGNFLIFISGNFPILFVEGWNSFYEDYSLFVNSLAVYSIEFFQRPVDRSERECWTQSRGLCSWVLFTLVWGVFPWCCDTRSISGNFLIFISGNFPILFVEGWNSFHEDYSLLVSSLGVYSSEFFQRPVGFQRERVLNTKSGFVFLGFYLHSYEVFSHGVATPWVWVLSVIFVKRNWWESTRDVWLVRRGDLVWVYCKTRGACRVVH